MRNRKVTSLILIAALVMGGASTYIFRHQIRTIFDMAAGVDYQGTGDGTASLVIKSGDSGEQVARNLVEAGVTKNFTYTYKRIIARNPVFLPGTYSLKIGMSTDSALDLLADPNSKVSKQLTVKEGWRLNVLLNELSEASGINIQEFKAAMSDPRVFGLPKSLPNMDGYLFPATYEIEPGRTATELIQMMVDRMTAELQKFKVPNKDRHSVLTLASIIQKEARKTPDFYKVSRVFSNRLSVGMHLQSDATVSYGSGGNTVTTTDSERADANGYNTYVHAGLPIGPIGAPGATAIDAALHPEKGSWLYFCAINLRTGETVFSSTYADHAKAVKRWQDWMRENPGWNG